MKKFIIKNKIFSIGNILKILFGVFILLFVVFQIDYQYLHAAIKSINFKFLLFGAFAYILKSLVRSLRIILINNQPFNSYFSIIRLTLITNLAGQVIPLKLGEMAYVYLLKQLWKIPAAKGLSSLFMIRLFDLIAISLLFIIILTLFGVPTELSLYFQYIFYCLVFLFISVMLIILISHYKSIYVPWFFSNKLKNKFMSRLLNWVMNFVLEMGKLNYQKLLINIFLSLVEWTINYGVFHALLLGIGFAPKYIDTIVCVTFAALASVIPISSFGNIGMLEIGWATGLILLGYPKSLALSSGFTTHLFVLGYIIFLGLIAWLSYILRSTNVFSFANSLLKK